MAGENIKDETAAVTSAPKPETEQRSQEEQPKQAPAAQVAPTEPQESNRASNPGAGVLADLLMMGPSDQGPQLKKPDPRPQPKSAEQKKLEALEKQLAVLERRVERATLKDVEGLKQEIDILLRGIQSLSSRENRNEKVRTQAVGVERRCNLLKERFETKCKALQVQEQREKQQQPVAPVKMNTDPSLVKTFQKRAKAPNARSFTVGDGRMMASVTVSSDGRQVQIAGNRSGVEAAQGAVLKVPMPAPIASEKMQPPIADRSYDAMRQLRPAPQRHAQ